MLNRREVLNKNLSTGYQNIHKRALIVNVKYYIYKQEHYILVFITLSSERNIVTLDQNTRSSITQPCETISSISHNMIRGFHNN